MTTTELVTAFADMIRKKEENENVAWEYAGAFGRMVGVLDTLAEEFPQVRDYIKDQLERNKP